MTPSLSERLRRAAAGVQSERVTVDTMVQAHGQAAQGSLMLLLAVPCLLPIPGTGTVLGFGLLAMAVAMWRGHADAALPRRVTELEMPSAWARRVLGLLASIYEVAARVARERAGALHAPAAGAWLATVVAAMAVVLILPIPFGNVLPALALTVIGLGLAFRDGVLVLAGAVSAVLTVVLMSAVLVLGLGWGMDLASGM